MFGASPRFPIVTINCFHSSPLFAFSALNIIEGMGGWVCKHGCYLRFIYLKSTYKLQALWSTELGSWLWKPDTSWPPAASGPVRPSWPHRWHFSNTLHLPPHRNELHVLHFAEGWRWEWLAKFTKVSDSSMQLSIRQRAMQVWIR